jgi:hypothetical protein
MTDFMLTVEWTAVAESTAVAEWTAVAEATAVAESTVAAEILYVARRTVTLKDRRAGCCPFARRYDTS